MMAMARMKLTRKTKGKGLSEALTMGEGATTLKVGILMGTGVHPESKTGATIAEIAFWNEFGTHEETIEAIPARPFLRTGIRDARDTITKIISLGFKQMALGNMTADTLNKLIGEAAVAAIQNKITSLSSPPNASSTIRAKGSSNPLIDTGAMKQHITWGEA
jgi:hypothetical protein